MAKPKKLLDPAAVERHAARGLTDGQIAAQLGVSPDTFTARKRENPAIVEALTRGRQHAVGLIENVAFECALQAAEKPEYQRSMMFFLKCRAGWKETQVVEHGGTVGLYNAREELREKLRALTEGP
jgi:hypothetical protein